MINLFQDFLNWTGSNNTSSVQYGFWSGFGSDLGEITLIGFAVAIYKRHKCSACFRPIWHPHPVEGTHYQTCHKHATLNSHNRLYLKHKREHPHMHELLNQGDKNG